MDALISGQADIAVLVRGNDILLLDGQSTGADRKYPFAAVPYLFAGATDVIEMKSVTLEAVRAQMKFALACDRALQFSLICLDGAEDEANVELGIECVEEMFSDREVYDFVGNRVYSRPLPNGADILRALKLARRFPSTESFLESLESDQPQIQRYRASWDSLPTSLFQSLSAKLEFEQTLIASGAFRQLIGASRDPSAYGLAAIQCHQSLSTHPNFRKVLKSWLENLKPAATSLAQKQFESESQVHRSHGDDWGFVKRTATTHELFENVLKQKQAIVDLLHKGDIAHVRAYSAQLAESQLKTGGPEYAAMSLCGLAQEAKNIHEYSLQLELALSAVEVAPEDGWSHGQVADAYFCLGQYDNALNSFALAAAFGEGEFAGAGCARILRAKGKLDDALAAFEQLIVSYPDAPSAWYGRAEVYRDMFKLHESLQAYELAINKFPIDSVARCGRAAVLTDMGRLNEALAAYDQTILDCGDDVVPLCGRADVLKQLGRLSESFEGYSVAATKFPREPIPRSGQASVLKEMGRLQEALQAFSDTAEAFPFDAAPYSGRAETLKEMGRLDEALASYEITLDRFPENLRARNGKANVLKKLGRLKESLRVYDENIKRSPYDVVAWAGRADLLKELGNLNEAIAAYDVLIGRNTEKQSLRNAKAAILAVMRRYEDALALLVKGPPQTRDEWVSEHIRGMIFLRRKRLDEAIKIFDSSLLKIPFACERKYFENALAVARLQQRQFEAAINCLSVQQEPLAKVLQMHAFAGLQRQPEARKVFDELQTICPPNLIALRNEVAARYRISRKSPQHDSRWLFDEECRNVLLLAA